MLGRSWSCCSWRFSEKSAPAADGKDEILSPLPRIIATLPFAGWHWLQPRSGAHRYTRPAIDQGQAIEGRCLGVTDGNTIKVLSAGNELIRVRLAFIDTPEKAQAFGQRAKQGIHELVFGKNVELRPHAVERCGRTVAQVFIDGRDAGLELLKQGLAWVYE